MCSLLKAFTLMIAVWALYIVYYHPKRFHKFYLFFCSWFFKLLPFLETPEKPYEKLNLSSWLGKAISRSILVVLWLVLVGLFAAFIIYIWVICPF